MIAHSSAQPAAPTLSIVIPVYNEDESLEELMASIAQAMTPIDISYEVVFVDDGSTDGTFERLKALAAAHRRVRVFSFRRNLGKSPALLCGFHRAAGQYILTMDADLQDDPGNFQRMYDQMLSERADIVSGWRRERRDNVVKRASSRIFNRLMIRLLFGCSFNDMNSGLKLYKSEAARELHLYGGMHRFIPLIATEMGYRVLECPVKHSERKYGASKYSPGQDLHRDARPPHGLLPDQIHDEAAALLCESRIGPDRAGRAVPGVSDNPLDPEHPDRHEAPPDVRRAARRHWRTDGVHGSARRPDRQRGAGAKTGVSPEVRVGQRRRASTRLGTDASEGCVRIARSRDASDKS